MLRPVDGRKQVRLAAGLPRSPAGKILGKELRKLL